MVTTAPTALVGSTGLVGSNLLRSEHFDVAVHSADRDRLAGRRFSRTVFAAARAEKWRANAAADDDLAHLADVTDTLASFSTDRLVLVSTIDVYPSPRNVDEATPIDADAGHAYGRHRLALEAAARRLHPHVVVVRLPGLFGPGLKKNALFDLLTDHRVDRIDARGRFQFYDLHRLAGDLRRVERLGEPMINITSEPLEIGSVASDVFSRRLEQQDGAAVEYDVRSRFCDAWQHDDGYLYSADDVLRDLRAFVEDPAR